jgi:hypothetical protein
MQKTDRQIPEPRVMAKPLPLSGLVKLVGNKKAVLWIEYKCGGDTEPKIFSQMKEIKGWGNMAVFTDGDSRWLDTYGKLWRAWFLREPTEMERKNAPEWKV